jgi:hypothetical protein
MSASQECFIAGVDGQPCLVRFRTAVSDSPTRSNPDQE